MITFKQQNITPEKIEKIYEYFKENCEHIDGHSLLISKNKYYLKINFKERVTRNELKFLLMYLEYNIWCRLTQINSEKDNICLMFEITTK